MSAVSSDVVKQLLRDANEYVARHLHNILASTDTVLSQSTVAQGLYGSNPVYFGIGGVAGSSILFF
jgi:hypothetical protein